MMRNLLAALLLSLPGAACAGQASDAYATLVECSASSITAETWAEDEGSAGLPAIPDADGLMARASQVALSRGKSKDEVSADLVAALKTKSEVVTAGMSRAEALKSIGDDLAKCGERLKKIEGVTEQ